MNTVVHDPGALAAAGNDPVEAHFLEVAKALDRAVSAGERYTAWLEAETSDFVRMNRGKVRQAGRVEQRYLRLRLIAGTRHAEHVLTLVGDGSLDARAAVDALAGLRSALPELAEDPHLLLPTDVASTRSVHGGALPRTGEVIERVLDAAKGEDLVGFYASGPVYRGFANSERQRNWHAVSTFNLDWSLYHRADKAVKTMYAGFVWSDDELAGKMADARERLALIARPPKALAPGRYRAWITPSAMEEVASLLRWNAFSGRSVATKQSAFTRMESGERLDPRAGRRQRLVQHPAAAIDDDGGRRVDAVEQTRRQRAAPQPDAARHGERRQPQPDAAHLWDAQYRQHA